MSDEQEQRQDADAVRDALRRNPCMREIGPERGFHACFEVPVALRRVLAHGIRVNHDVPANGDGEAGPQDREGVYRVLVALLLRAEGGGGLGVQTGVDLEFLARRSSGTRTEWLSATRIRDPETGAWVQTADPAAVQRLLHDVCPGWAEVVRAEVVRLAASRQAGE